VTLPVGVYRATGSPVYLVLGGVVVAAAILFYLLTGPLFRRLNLKGNRSQLVSVIESHEHRNGRVGPVDRIAARMAFVMRHDLIAALVFLLLLFGGGAVVVVLFALLTVLQAAYWALFLRRLKQAQGKSSQR